jgi:hypothetical protein
MLLFGRLRNRTFPAAGEAGSGDLLLIAYYYGFFMLCYAKLCGGCQEFLGIADLSTGKRDAREICVSGLNYPDPRDIVLIKDGGFLIGDGYHPVVI